MIATKLKPKSPRIKEELFNEDELTASICKESLFEFLREMWDVIIPEKPVFNWHIKYLCDRAQRAVERVFVGKPKKGDLVVNVPPGSTKSTVFSIMLNAWALVRMPSIRFLGGSYAYSLAQDLSRKTRDLIKSEKFKKLFPHVKIREDQDAKGHFITDKGGERYAVGSGGVVIGKHFHLIVIDDPIDPQAALSDAEVKQVNDWMENTLSQRKVDKAFSLTILVMQRLSEVDPSGFRLSKEKRRDDPIKHIRLPAELIGDDAPCPKSVAKMYVNRLLDPIRLPRSVLDREKKRGQFHYAGQYLQTPVPPAGGMFQTDKIEIDEPPIRWKKKVRFWDKAAVKGGGAYSVGLKLGQDMAGRFWILSVKRGQWNSGKREKIIVQTAKADGFKTIVGLEQEPGSGGKESAEETAKRLAGYRVKINKPTGDKVARADAVSVQVNIGNMFMKPAPWNEALLDEMKHFPNSKYKDQVDALSGAFSELIKTPIQVGAL